MKPKRKIISLLLCAAMLLSFCPTSVFAEAAAQDGGVSIGASGLCEHHPEHTEDCGYTEGTPESPCTHEHKVNGGEADREGGLGHTDECHTLIKNCVHSHTEDCYPQETVSGNVATPSDAGEQEPESCGHVCSEESGCIEKELDCKHEHDEGCGYAPAAEGTPCGFVCEICTPQDSGPTSGQSVQKSEGDLATPPNATALSVEDVQKLIDELPTADELAAMSEEQQSAVYDKVQAAYEAYNALTDEQKAEVTGAEIFDGLFAVFNGMANTLAEAIQYISYTWEDGQGRVEHSNTLNEPYNEINADSTGPVTWEGNTNGGYYVVTGGTADSPITFSERVTVSGSVHLILANGCHLKAAKGITVSEGNSLTIYATSEVEGTMGKLIAEGQDRTAGIGGFATYSEGVVGTTYASGGTITIHGGEINATAGSDSAGIGGGWGGEGGTITILGGKINATGGPGAGIGGGSSESADKIGDGGIIIIYGGDITAIAKNGGAGIGGGSGDNYDAGGGNGGTISIYGGHIEAKSEDGTGIGGGGRKGDGGKITISGGTIKATGTDGAGIGGGCLGNGGEITISGGTIEATSNAGAGIGGGEQGNQSGGSIGGIGGKITITGGNVTASSTEGAGIGGGSGAGSSDGASGGTISISGKDTQVKATGGTGACDIGSGDKDVPSDKIEIGGGATVTTEGTNGIGKSHVADTTTWDKDDTYHWRPCQVENCNQSHDFLTSTKTAHTWDSGTITNGELVYTCEQSCGYEKKYTCSGISVTGPTKLTYTEGDTLDLSGLEITATFGEGGDQKQVKLAYDSGNVKCYIGYSEVTNDTTLTTAHSGKTITVTWNGKTAPTGQLTVNAADAETPNITDHPDNASYTVGDTATHLSVTASVSDGGNLFFQWYSNTANNNTNGTKIDGETGSTYTPPTTAEGTTYYYCVVTNTKGQKSATAVSNTAEIKVSPAAPTEYTVTVNGSHATTTGVGRYQANAIVTIDAGSRSGYSFNGWTSSDGISFANAGSPSTTFVMPGKNVTVTANWTYNGGGGGGGTSYDYFTITASAGAGGSISPSGSFSVREGRDKTFTITPDSGYRISDVLIDGKSVGAVNTYTFEDVQKRHTIEAVFAKENPSTGGNPFTDVKESDWFYDDVMFVYGNGLMSGTSATTFEPYTVTTRAQIAAILYRLDGSPAVEGRNNYTDVEYGPGTAWYYDAATWAQQSGVMSGYGNNLFGPNDPVTRQQLAVTFYNYAKYKGYDVTAAGDLSGFADAGEISPWAQDAMKWAVGIGLMNGKGGGILDPQGTATRAEVAAMLHNFIERNHLVPPAVAPGGDGGAGGTGNGGGGWTQRTSSPQTGDNTPIWPFATLPVSAAGLVTCTILYCKRRKEEDEEPACYPA